MIRLAALLLCTALAAGCSDSSSHWEHGSTAPAHSSSWPATATWQQPGTGADSYRAHPGPGTSVVYWSSATRATWGANPQGPEWIAAINSTLASTRGTTTGAKLADLPGEWAVAWIPSTGLYLGPQAPIASGYTNSQRRLIVLAYRSHTELVRWQDGAFSALADCLDLGSEGLDGAVLRGLRPGYAREGEVVTGLPMPAGWTEPCGYAAVYTPRGVRVEVPEFVSQHEQWAGARDAFYLHVDTAPNDKGPRTIHDRPGGVVRLAGPGNFVSGVPVGGVYQAGLMVCSAGSHQGPSPHLSQVYTHELAHFHGWHGSHPATCSTCQVSGP